MNLFESVPETEYRITDIFSDDDEFTSFLLTLGCYVGETVTLISRKRSSCTISVKDARYNIDSNLAEAIQVADV